jgi:hypothetical protein
MTLRSNYYKIHEVSNGVRLSESDSALPESRIIDNTTILLKVSAHQSVRGTPFKCGEKWHNVPQPDRSLQHPVSRVYATMQYVRQTLGGPGAKVGGARSLTASTVTASTMSTATTARASSSIWRGRLRDAEVFSSAWAIQCVQAGWLSRGTTRTRPRTR